jgi:hypothetical protein
VAAKRVIPGTQIYQSFRAAQKIEQSHGRALTEKQYLDLIAPTRNERSEKQARIFMEKLRTGKSSGETIYKRAMQDVGAMFQVSYYDPNREGIKTGNIAAQLTRGKTRFQFWEEGESKLYDAMERAFRKKYPGKRGLSTAAEIMGAKKIRTSSKGREIIR